MHFLSSLRHITAHCFAASSRICARWIADERNPADRPSRVSPKPKSSKRSFDFEINHLPGPEALQTLPPVAAEHICYQQQIFIVRTCRAPRIGMSTPPVPGRFSRQQAPVQSTLGNTGPGPSLVVMGIGVPKPTLARTPLSPFHQLRKTTLVSLVFPAVHNRPAPATSDGHAEKAGCKTRLLRLLRSGTAPPLIGGARKP